MHCARSMVSLATALFSLGVLSRTMFEKAIVVPVHSHPAIKGDPFCPSRTTTSIHSVPTTALQDFLPHVLYYSRILHSCLNILLSSNNVNNYTLPSVSLHGRRDGSVSRLAVPLTYVSSSDLPSIVHSLTVDLFQGPNALSDVSSAYGRLLLALRANTNAFHASKRTSSLSPQTDAALCSRNHATTEHY